MDFKEFQKLNEITFLIRDDLYWIRNSKTAPKNFDNVFAVIRDDMQFTIVERAWDLKAQKIGHSYKIITFGPSLPSDLVGFISYISFLLAKWNVPIFALSSQPTDHILVRYDHLEVAIKALSEGGLTQKLE